MIFKMHNKKFYVSQVDERDCGAAALAMVFRKYKSKVSIAHLREIAKTDMEGTTLLGIITAAKHFNFETRAVKADMSVFGLKDIPFPFIAHVLTKDNYQHFYTVFGSSKNRVLIGDPNPTVGLTWISKTQFEHEWDGYSVFIAPGPGYKPNKEKSNGLLDLFPLLLKQHALVTQIVLSSLMVTIVSIIGSYYLQGINDTYVPGQLKNTLGIVSIGLVVAYVIQQLLSYAQNYMLTIMGQRLSIDIILGYIRHIFELPMSFFGTRRTGEVVSRFTDANQIIDALASTIISLMLDLGIVLVVGTVLAIQNVNLFLIALISVPLYSLIIFAFVRTFNRFNNDRMQAGSMLSSSIIEDINGIETIKSLNSESHSYKKIDREYVEMLDSSFAYEKSTIMQSALKQLLQLILNTAVLWYGANLVMSGKLSLGELITFNALLAYFVNPLESIINLQTKLQAARVANNRLNEVFLVESEFDNKSGFNSSVKKIKLGDILIEHLKFRYGLGGYVLDDISTEIKQNSSVALVGVSGSGKSTLVKLLVRFFDPEAGELRLGNTPLEDLDKKDLRATINYLPQEPFIFTGSIRDNLMLGHENEAIGLEQLMMALDIAALKEDVEQMPLGLDTEITSDGGGLSGGQRQRVAIARAVLADTPIMILDESTSNLDLITEKKVVENLLTLPDKTLIFVAHRLSIAEKVGNIIVMDHGKIVEQGKHEQLKNNGGYYDHLLNA